VAQIDLKSQIIDQMQEKKDSKAAADELRKAQIAHLSASGWDKNAIPSMPHNVKAEEPKAKKPKYFEREREVNNSCVAWSATMEGIQKNASQMVDLLKAKQAEYADTSNPLHTFVSSTLALLQGRLELLEAVVDAPEGTTREEQSLKLETLLKMYDPRQIGCKSAPIKNVNDLMHIRELWDSGLVKHKVCNSKEDSTRAKAALKIPTDALNGLLGAARNV